MDYKIYLLGINHNCADVDIREKFALPDMDPNFLLRSLPAVREALVLSTCNRVELLCVSDRNKALQVSEILETWAGQCGEEAGVLKEHAYALENGQAVEHLFSVASSLDSMVLGEPQILGQLKDAYRKAVYHRAPGPVINRMLHKSFSVAKKVRTETAVASSAVSISYAAVELARKIFGELEGKKAMLVGAGEMAELAAAHLLNCGIAEILVANRTLRRGRELADRFGGRAVGFEDILDWLGEVDIVISSTGASSTVISAAQVRKLLKRRKNRPMFFIDIAVPRDIDPDVNMLDNVYLYDIDDLREVVEENLAGRQEEARKAREIVKGERDKFTAWLNELDLSPTIQALLNSGEEIAQREVNRTLRSIGDCDEHTVRALETMASSLVRKLYREPIVFLKRRAQEEGSAREFIHLARRIFNLDKEDIPQGAHKNRKKDKE
ncbi:MAG: glutamyl-tRNA reductase [Desulfonatronovibrionaceae bacterium]